MLKHLRWEFDVVAGHAGAGDGGIDNARTEAVQCVAKLVEQRGGVVPADECRLTRQRLREVAVVGDDRRDGAVEVFLGSVAAHPGARLLPLSGVWVEVPQPHHHAGRVTDSPDPHVGMVDGHFPGIGRLKLQSEQLAGREEHRLAEVVELQVGCDLALVEVVLRPADFFSVEAVVPRGDLDPCPFRIGDGLHVGHLLADSRHGGLPDRLHQFHGTFGRLGHRVFQPPVGVGRVAEQLGAAGPQREDRGDSAVVVGGTAARAAIDEHPPDPLSRVAALGMGEEGLDARPRVGDGPAALLATGLRGLGGGLTQRVRQACQIGGIVEKDGPVVFVAEQVLAEGRGQRRQLLVERRELRLRCGIEPRTVADKMGVGQPDDPLLLGRQRCLLP